MRDYELIVVGGGPAGLAAALAAWENGLRNILVLERDSALGGILNQCVHNGFGLHRFKEELTGPEYAGRFIDMLSDTDIRVRTDAMVLSVAPDRTVQYISPADGCRTVRASAVVLAMGCRERTRGAISVPGDRCAGIFTAGAAQRFINIEGQMVGRRVVILGSGDIGLIMARRMTLEGAKVLACVELMPYSGGLNRNIVQCLHDYDIPLYLSHTVTDIVGRDRLEKVAVSRVDERRQPIPGTEQIFDCDTLLLSVGLLPENELTRALGAEMDPRTNGAVVYENMETSIPGVFACGNVLQVHDLVDFVSAESGPPASDPRGERQRRHLHRPPAHPGGGGRGRGTDFLPGEPGIREIGRHGQARRDTDRPVQAGPHGPRRDGTHPIARETSVPGRGRRHHRQCRGGGGMKELICIVCPNGCHLRVDEANGYTVTGNACPRGEEYGRNELLHPVRVLTGTVRLPGAALRRGPVKTNGAIPKEKLLEAAQALCGVDVRAPVHIGEVVLPDVCGTGVDVVATRNILAYSNLQNL